MRIYVLDITERKWAEERLQQQNAYLGALHDTTLGLISRLDLNELLEALIARAGQLLGTSHGFIFLVDPDGEELEQKVGTGVFSAVIGFRLKPGEGVSGKIWQTGEPLVVEDYDSYPDRAADFEYNLIGSVLGVPLKSGDRVVGTIGMAHDAAAGRRFSPEEIELLNRFAELAAIALDNAQLFAQTQAALAASEEYVYRMALLNEMGQLMNLAPREAEIFKVATHYIPR